MKNHRKINGQLLQTNKKFSQLKEKQKLKINEWLYEAYIEYITGQIAECDVINIVYDKIEAAEIWIPYCEVDSYYFAHKSKFKKRYEKSLSDTQR